MPLTGPIEPPAFDALMAVSGPYERAPTLAVAVSGGADSMALVLLAHAWAQARGGRVVGLTVDHGLRRESGEEAVRVGGWLRARGIDHRTLDWQGPKPATAVQELARRARYALMEDWCARHGVLHLLIAHHADDQAETVALRAAMSSGADGAAGMAPVRETKAVRLVRPLLAVPKARLLATCRAAGQSWIEDPGNLSTRFARGRLRASSVATLPQASADTAKAAQDRADRDDAVADRLAADAAFLPEGWATLSRMALAGDDAVALRLLARCAMAVGGSAYPPRGERLARLLAALRHDAPTVRSLAGCLFMPHGTGWRVVREPDAVEQAVTIARGATVLWDGRFRVHWSGEGTVDCGALGAEGWRALRPGAAVSLPSAVGRTLPALRRDGRILAVPHLCGGPGGTGVLDCGAWFAPPEPAAGPRFSVVYGGGDII